MSSNPSLPDQLRAHTATLRAPSEATLKMLEGIAATLEITQGDPRELSHEHPDYLAGLEAEDRSDVDDLLGLSTFGFVPPFGRGRLRAIAQRLAWLERVQRERTQEELDELNGADTGGEVTL